MFRMVLRRLLQRGSDTGFRDTCLQGLLTELRDVPWERKEGVSPELWVDAAFAADYRRALRIEKRARHRWPPSTNSLLYHWLTLLGWRLAVEHGYRIGGRAALLEYIVEHKRVRRSEVVHWTDAEIAEALADYLYDPDDSP